MIEIGENQEGNLVARTYRSERIIDKENVVEFLWTIINKFHVELEGVFFKRFVIESDDVETSAPAPVTKDGVIEFAKTIDYDEIAFIGTSNGDLIGVKVELSNESHVTVCVDSLSLIDLNIFEDEIK